MPATQPQSGSVTWAAAMCRPGGREPGGGEGDLQSHSLQDWLELDPGPPRHHTLEVVPSGPPAPPAKGWAGPVRGPRAPAHGAALFPPCQAWAHRPIPWVQDAPHSPDGQHRKLEKEAHPSRPRGPVDSGGPDVRL